MGHGDVRCVVLGGGGHARVVIEALRGRDSAVPFAVLDANPKTWGAEVLGVPVLGSDELIAGMRERGVMAFVVGLGSIGDSGLRRRLFELGIAHGLKPISVCHPTSVLSPSANIGGGTVLLAGAIVNSGASIGANVIVNSGAIVEHDCVLENHVHVATGARLASAVRVGAGAHIGAGATVRQSLTIGESAIVGAGAVVVKDVPPNVVVVGVPARSLEQARE